MSMEDNTYPQRANWPLRQNTYKSYYIVCMKVVMMTDATDSD